MRFLYQYRTSENELRHGVVKASDRDSAFAALKAQGIRPSKVEEAPGLLNKLFGKGKRWMAIVVLALLAAIGWWLAVSEREPDWEERSQIYGDPVLIKELSANNWAAVFANEGDRFLAAYAVPGRAVADLLPPKDAALAMKGSISIEEEDGEVVRKMKRIVNGMKREMREYVRDGGSLEGYFRRLAIRQKAEAQVLSAAERSLKNESNPQKWAERNRQLRAMGLPMLEPEEIDQ